MTCVYYRYNKLKQITFVAIAYLLAATAVVTALMPIRYDDAMAKKKHKSAAELGAHDANPGNCTGPNDCHLYITQPGKGFNDHSEQFNKNYINGYCAGGGGGSDADQATFTCRN